MIPALIFTCIIGSVLGGVGFIIWSLVKPAVARVCDTAPRYRVVETNSEFVIERYDPKEDFATWRRYDKSFDRFWIVSDPLKCGTRYPSFDEAYEVMMRYRGRELASVPKVRADL